MLLSTLRRVFHETAVQTELGIVLGVIVQVQGADAYAYTTSPIKRPMIILNFTVPQLFEIIVSPGIKRRF